MAKRNPSRVQPGKALQRLIETIERAVNNRPEISVESPKRIPDKDTGRLREHDVVITFSFQHHRMLTALECKDKSRKIGVPDIEAFRAKCLRTGIDRGIMVSSLGFTQSAIEKAHAQNIGCLTLSEVAAFDWCLVPGIEQRHVVLSECGLHCITDEPVEGAIRLFDVDGTEIGQQQVKQIGLNAIKQLPAEKRLKQGCAMCRDVAPNFYGLDKSNKRVALKEMHLYLRWEIKTELLPFEFRRYFDTAAGRLLYDTATAKIDFGFVKGDIVMVKPPGEDTTILFVPEKPALTKL